MKWLFCLFILTGCYRNHLYVQQEWINSTFLASSKVGTPDPRTSNPPIGQRLLIAWDFPKSLFDQGLTLIATVRLWNNTQTTLNLPIDRKRDTTAFFFPNATSDIDRKILTYLVQVTTSNGEIVATWEHHFWTKLIDLDRKDSLASASRINASVSSHPIQGSVIETP